jgi:CHAT domain-containing protein
MEQSHQTINQVDQKPNFDLPELMPGKSEIYGNLYVTNPPTHLINHNGRPTILTPQEAIYLNNYVTELSPFEASLVQMIDPANIQRLTQIYGTLADHMEKAGASTKQIEDLGSELRAHYITPHDSNGQIEGEVPEAIIKKVDELFRLPQEELDALVYGNVEKIEKVTKPEKHEAEDLVTTSEDVESEKNEDVIDAILLEDESHEEDAKIVDSAKETIIDTVGEHNQPLIATEVEGTREFPAQQVVDAILKALYENSTDDPEELNHRLNNALAALEDVPHPAEVELLSAIEEIGRLIDRLEIAHLEAERLNAEATRLNEQRENASLFITDLMGSLTKLKVKKQTHFVLNMDSLDPKVKEIIESRLNETTDDESSSAA